MVTQPKPWMLTVIGATLALLAMIRTIQAPAGVMDLDQLWQAGQALRAGLDPYQVIGPGQPYEFRWPFYYPFTGALFGIPLSWLPLPAARVGLVMLGGALFGYAIGKTRPDLWPLLLSWPFISASRVGQWSPYFAAALLLPAVGAVAVLKPNLALVLLAGARERKLWWVVAGSLLVLLGISLAIRPDWPLAWREQLAAAEHFKPLVFRPGGFLMLAGLLRWRDPDARLIVALSLVPQTGMSYEALPALTVARTRVEALGLTVLSQLALGGTAFTASEPFALESWQIGTLTLWFILFPALALVLRRGRS